MYDVNLTLQTFQSARHDPIVQTSRPLLAQKPIWDAKSSAGERRPHSYAGGHRSLKSTRKYQKIRSCRREAIYLLPSGVADSVRAELERKTVEDSHWMIAVILVSCHLHLSVVARPNCVGSVALSAGSERDEEVLDAIWSAEQT
jgi:hypothetical protein